MERARASTGCLKWPWAPCLEQLRRHVQDLLCYSLRSCFSAPSDKKHLDHSCVTGFLLHDFSCFIALMRLLVYRGYPMKLGKPPQAMQFLALGHFECISNGSSGALSDNEWIYAMRRQPVERQRDMPLGPDFGCLMPCLYGDALRWGLLGCRVSAPLGLPGNFSATLFFTEYVATYTMGCSLLPPVWHCACHWPGGSALSKVRELSTRDVAIRCSTCFLWRPIVSFGAGFLGIG